MFDLFKKLWSNLVDYIWGTESEESIESFEIDEDAKILEDHEIERLTQSTPMF